MKIILQLIIRKVQGTYNLGATGPGWSKAEFGLRLGEQLGLDLSRVQIGKMSEMGLCAMRPSDMTMNVQAVEGVLGYPLPSMEDTIRQLVVEAPSAHSSVVFDG